MVEWGAIECKLFMSHMITLYLTTDNDDSESDLSTESIRVSALCPVSYQTVV